MYTRDLGNVSYRRRVRQAVVLLFTIIIGILISQSTQADKDKTKGNKVEVLGK
jgi:hypothetical protein